jgi:hypothetical protein
MKRGSRRRSVCSLARALPLAAGQLSLVLLALFLLAAASGCEPQRRVVVKHDGETRVLMTAARTVREALGEAGIGLGPLDEVDPPIWSEIDRSATLEVIRGREVVVESEIPFARETVRDEALSASESRIAQLGVNGRERITYLVKSLQGQEIEREVLEVQVLEEPRNEVVVVGVRGDLPSVPLQGTIAYVSNGNAWLMRGSSAEKRPLTFEGNLDQRAFSLSSDGARLLFSRAAPEGSALLNSLWAVNTVVVGAQARPLGIEGVIYAEWSPDGSRFAYSTAQRTPTVPGWQAENDLWISTEDGVTRTMVLPPSSQGAYSWWGTDFAWSPDGTALAYATADSVGVVDAARGNRTPLLRFPEHHTYQSWVWVPSPSWAPDGRFLASAIHSSFSPAGTPEDSPLFDLWVIGVDGTFAAKLAEQVGMWSYPRWSPQLSGDGEGSLSRIIYGVAQSKRHTEDSAYDLYIMDRDGSNRDWLYPPEGGQGLLDPQVVWSPRGDQALFKRDGNLYLLDVASKEPFQLTSDGRSGHAQWKGS